MDCIFCKIVKGEAPAWRVYEDDKTLVILDKYPASRGHLLVVTKEHYTSIMDAPLELAAHAFAVATRFGKIWGELGAPGVNIVTNAGRAAGQVVFHFHVHVIPRWPEGQFKWHGTREITEEEARWVISQLSKALGHA